jgi:hypothetical protein
VSWTIAIPYEVPSQNTRDGWHWSRCDKDTKAAERLIRFLGNTVPRPTGRRLVEVIAYRKQRCADTANLIGGAKGLLDALVRAGLLKDDRDQLAAITYDQHPLSKLPDDHLKRFGRVPVTVITLTDQP